MQQAPTIFVILLYLAALLSTYMAAWAQLRARVPAAREFSLINLGVAFYTLGYAIEITRNTLPGILDAVRIEYLGLAFLPSLFLLFTIHFTSSKAAPWYFVLSIMIIPLITLGMVLTVEFHQLFYIDPQIVQGEMFPMLSFEQGFWYKINFIYQQCIGVLSASLLFVFNFRNKPKQRKQAFVIACASLIPILSGVVYILKWIPGHLDPGPFCLTITALLFAYALFKLGLLELVPAARELALDSIRDGFLVVDRMGRLQDLNKAAWQLPGAAEFIIGEPFPVENSLYKKIKPLLENKGSNLEFSTDDGKYFHAKAQTILANSSYQKGLAILISDITETASLMLQLKQQANIDDLTGIFNRRQLIQLGEREIRRLCGSNLPLGIILIDLDHFKLINDQYGHAAGDEVLRQVVHCFRGALRTVDIFGRYGGEEFVIFLPGIAVQPAACIAQRLAGQLNALDIEYEGKKLSISASFGIHAVCPDEDTSMDDLLQQADHAMYYAKRNGRNQVVLFEDCKDMS
jgi:diguanylate cyclase (GGDEF)-like protein